MAEEPQTPTAEPPAESPPLAKPARSRRNGGDRKGKGKLVVARYGRMKHIGLFRHHLETPPDVGTMLVVRTERGTELGRVLINVGPDESPHFIRKDKLDSFIRANGGDYPFRQGGRALRLANPQDVNDQQHLDRSAHEEDGYCRDQIKALGLDMKIVEVEHLLGGERIVFYFTAEHRVDFRELVKRMAGRYHTRIEMRQVGARDEARLVADYERCGQHCCCKQFLKFLKPVSMRMAKMQKATLDPTKISGRCGRLMCCLRYEDSSYEALAAALPKKNRWVRTADGVVGKVIDVQILTQLVVMLTPNRQRVAVANEEIVDRDVPEPEAMAAPPPQPRPAPVRPSLAQPRKKDRIGFDEIDEKLADMQVDVPDEPVEAAETPAETAETPAGEKRGERGGKPRRRGRRRRRPSKEPQAQSQGGPTGEMPSAPAGGDAPKAEGQGKSGKSSRGRRRRRRRRPSGGGSGEGKAPSGGDS